MGKPFLHCHHRFKNGKDHCYWSIAEKVRTARGSWVPRHIERGEAGPTLAVLHSTNPGGSGLQRPQDDWDLRPIFHQKQKRIEAHIFVAFTAYCLHVSLRTRLRRGAPGLTPRSVLDKFAEIQMLDLHFPTTDGRELIFRRYTQPEKDQKMLLAQLGWELPPPPPPRITSKGRLAGD